MDGLLQLQLRTAIDSARACGIEAFRLHASEFSQLSQADKGWVIKEYLKLSEDALFAEAMKPAEDESVIEVVN